jgi:hypothetical protein
VGSELVIGRFTGRSADSLTGLGKLTGELVEYMFERSAILDDGVRVVDLTSTERALLRACEGLIDEDPQGRRPPFRQIAMRVGLAPSTVYGHSSDEGQGRCHLATPQALHP